MKTSTLFKSFIVISLLGAVLGSWFYAFANTKGMIGGYANDNTVAGYGNCTHCHTKNKLYYHKGEIVLNGFSTKGANITSGYASDTFNMAIAYPKSDIGKGHCYGFQVTAIDSSTGKPLGILWRSDTANTSMSSKLIGSSMRTYISHSAKGITAATGKYWIFNWIPPKVSTGGTVAFYVCVLSADNSGSATDNDTTWSDTFFYRPVPSLSASFTYSPTSICAGTPVKFKDASKGTVAHYNWTFKDGSTTATDTNQNPTYTFYNYASADSAILTIKDSKGKVSTYKTSISILIPPKPVITSSSSSVCKLGDSIVLKSSGWSAYTWSNGSTADSIYVKDTSKTYTVTVINSSGCSGTSAPFKLKLSPPVTGPSLSANVKVICAGSSVTFTAGTGFSYYTFMDSTTILMLKQSSNVLTTKFTSGSHKVTVTGISSSGCSSSPSSSVLVSVSLPPVMTLASTGASGSSSTEYCGSDNVTLTATPNTLANYKFYQNSTLLYSGTKNTCSFAASTINSGDLFTVKGTNIAGCSDSTKGLSLTYSAALKPAFTYLDNKGVVTFHDSTQGGKPSKYSWDYGDLTPYDTTSGPMHNYKSGIYTVVLKVTNASGCTYSTSKSIQIVISAVQMPVTFSSVKAYPNPVKEKLFIDVNSEEDQKAELTLIDLNGRTVAKQKINLSSGDNNVIFEMNGVAPGTYILSLKGRQDINTLKVTRIE